MVEAVMQQRSRLNRLYICKENMMMSAFRMHCLKLSARAALLLVITLIATNAAFAQARADAADLRGYVRDQQNAVITTATVTARNPATNKSYTTTTNSDGFYQLLNLTPGEYDLTVEAPSFKKAVLPALRISMCHWNLVRLMQW